MEGLLFMSVPLVNKLTDRQLWMEAAAPFFPSGPQWGKAAVTWVCPENRTVLTTGLSLVR